jgi:hypothetical protein
MLLKKLKEFFASHPEIDTVFEALGYLFIDLEQAQKFCGGTAVAPVTYSRAQFTGEENAESPAGSSQTGTDSAEASNATGDAVTDTNQTQSSPQADGTSEEVSSEEPAAEQPISEEVKVQMAVIEECVKAVDEAVTKAAKKKAVAALENEKKKLAELQSAA